MLKDIRENHDNETYWQAIKDRCETDLDLFSTYFFKHYCTHKPNEFHRDFEKQAEKIVRGYRRAWAAPRGSAKSVKVSLIKPIHDACYALEQFILIISATDSLAVQKLKDIRDEILSNDLLRCIYGISFDKRNPGETAFIVNTENSKIYFMAVGRGAQIRGVRFGPHRPTKIICDDIEHSEKVYSEKQRDKTESYFKEDIGKVGDENTNIEVVGTILHRQSLLAKLLINPAYSSKKYKSIIEWSGEKELWNEWEKIYMNIMDETRLENANAFFEQNKDAMLKNTRVMWPEKESYVHLMKELMEIGKRAFMKEKQNDPLGADDRVFENIAWYVEIPQGIQIEETKEIIEWDYIKNRCCGALDPSTGQTKSSQSRLGDFACLLVAYQEPKGRLLIHWDWTKRIPPTQQIEQIFEAHHRFNFEKFGVETNLYRELLLPNIIAEKKLRERKENKIIKIPFYDIINTENKDKRIHRLEPKIAHKWILFNKALSHEFINQITEYPHADHDDCPDCLEMIWNLVHNKYKASPLSISAMSGR
jgi:predicted phage terminase large subunit-like protein